MKFGQKAHFFLAGILMTVGCAGRQVEYIAHRGASWEAPENTLSAIRRAWEVGADAVEVDVHLTADNRLAVIHDKDTRRTAGVDWQVSQKTLHELQSLDDGRTANRLIQWGVKGITTNRPDHLKRAGAAQP